MVERIVYKEIEGDFKQLTPRINGKILKVVCRAEEWIPHARVVLMTSEAETVIDHTIDMNINIWKPFYFGEKITNEQVWADYFYSFGAMVLSVEGMEEGDYIRSIEIFYE